MATKRKLTVPVLPEGYFDIVPGDQKYWHFVWRKVDNLLADYSFNQLDLAPLELAETFIRPVEHADPDRPRHLAMVRIRGAQGALRADLMPSIMRAYLQHGMQVEPHPVKMFADSPVFVPSDRGHVMHYQIGVQTIGDNTEAVDAELLFLGCRIMEALGLGSFVVRLNTIGDAASQQAYQRALRDFFRTHQKKLSARLTALVKEHLLAALPVLAQELPDVAKDAPQSVDFLSDEARLFFKRLLEFLDEGQVPYVIDHTLVTADDCAAHTLWQFVLDPVTAVGDLPEPSGLSAGQAGLPVIIGGRIDRLAELLGGTATPAAGWALDVDAIVTRLKAKNANVPDAQNHAKVFLSQLGDAAKRRSLMLFEEIRRAGIDVRYSLSRDTIKGQLRMAQKFGAKLALIFGQKEALEGTVMVREMDTGIQETIPLEKIVDELKKRLRKNI